LRCLFRSPDNPVNPVKLTLRAKLHVQAVVYFFWRPPLGAAVISPRQCNNESELRRANETFHPNSCAARITNTGLSKRQLKAQSGNNPRLSVLIGEDAEPSSEALF